MHLLLASSSPRRAALLQQIGVPHQRLAPPDIDERPASGEAPEDYVRRMAEEKARAGATALKDARHGPILGADTAVVWQGRILGKPRDPADARRMLAGLSGDEHQVLSAVSLLLPDWQRTLLSATRVRFRPLTEQEIDRYVETGEPMDKAGGYGIQGFGGLLVEHLSGSYSGVVGLPLNELHQLLAAAGVSYWQTIGTGSD